MHQFALKQIKNQKQEHLRAPLRRPPLEFSNAPLVTNLKIEVSAPDAAKPARKDWGIQDQKAQKSLRIRDHVEQNWWQGKMIRQVNAQAMEEGNINLHEFRLHKGKIPNHSSLNMSICNSERTANDTNSYEGAKPSSSRCC